MTPDPNCSNCNSTGKIAAIALDIHGDGQHDCFCVTYDQGPQHPEDMTREEVNTEILEWREGRLYRGYDRYLAEQVPGLKAEIQRLQAALPTPAKEPSGELEKAVEALEEIANPKVWRSDKSNVDMALQSLSPAKEPKP